MKANVFFTIFFTFVIQINLALAEPPLKIEDNSFLIEEAYNQEPGVVQHINVWQWNHEDDSWDYTFTQEWPIFSQEHQFSYVVPVSRTADPTEIGFGDLLLNYRYQIENTDELAIAPRFSISAPTGDDGDGLGAGSVAYQFNLPVSISHCENVVSHWNLGFTTNPEEHDIDGNKAGTYAINYGASVVYLAHPIFNFLVEVVGTSGEEVSGQSTTDDVNTLVINPGWRFALNFESGLQIVPGVSFPIGVGPSEGEWSVLTYLSFEHAF